MVNMGKPCRMGAISAWQEDALPRGQSMHLSHIVDVAILDSGHLAIHAVLHRHARRVVRVPKGAHACQIHPSLHVRDLSRKAARPSPGADRKPRPGTLKYPVRAETKASFRAAGRQYWYGWLGAEHFHRPRDRGDAHHGLSEG